MILTREQIEARIKEYHETAVPPYVLELCETALALSDENESLTEEVKKGMKLALVVENMRAENARLKECMKDMFSMEDMDAAQFEVNRLTIENARLREEVHADNLLLNERNRLLKLFDCPVHGECVPYAIEQVEALREVVEAIRKALYIAGPNPKYHNEQKERLKKEWPTLWAALARLEGK